MKLATKALCKGVVLVVAGVAIATAGVLLNAQHAARERAQANLRMSSEVVHDFADQSWELLRLRGQVLAGDPAFVDYVTQSLVPDAKLGGVVDKLSISRLLNERRQGDDILMLLDAEGMEVTGIGVIGKTPEVIQHDPLVIAAISEGKTAQGIWLDNGAMAWVVIHPLMRGRTPQGYLVTASRATDASFAKLARLVHGDVALLTSLASHSLYSGGLDARYVDLLGTHQRDVLSVKTPTGQALALDNEATAIDTWITPFDTAQGHAAWVVFNSRTGFLHSLDTETLHLVLGIAFFGLFALACVIVQWASTWRPLSQLADAYDSGRGTIGRVKGSALLRDVRDRLELASRTRR